MAQHRGSRRTGLGLTTAHGFQFDICTDTKLAEEHHGLRQRGYPLATEAPAPPDTGVVPPKRYERESSRAPSAIGRPFDPVVVKQDQVSVSREPDIELDPATAEFRRRAQPGKRILRCASGGPAMAYHRRKRLGEMGSCRRRFAVERRFAPIHRVIPSYVEAVGGSNCDAVLPGMTYCQGAACACAGSERLAPRSSPVC
jgi:hypothetical protein